MFWEKYESLCRKKRKSPNAVARELGISSGSITKWKDEKIIPNGKTLIKIADYFNCSTDYLLGRNEKNKDKTIEALEDMLNGATYTECVKKYGKDYMLHYRHMKLLCDDIKAEKELEKKLGRKVTIEEIIKYQQENSSDI